VVLTGIVKLYFLSYVPVMTLPILFTFKFWTFKNEITTTDQNQNQYYINQKFWNLKEKIEIFDREGGDLHYVIDADKVIDIGAIYYISDNQGQKLGWIKNHGLKSFWRASYAFYNQQHQLIYTLKERNIWIKIADAIFSEIPVIGWFTGFIFNPEYDVIDSDNQIVATLVKVPGFWSRQFKLESKVVSSSDKLLLLGVITSLIFQRHRG
jgi:uncharacterized protein YxjI